MKDDDTPPEGYLTLRGMSLVCGMMWDWRFLVLNRDTRTVESFADFVCKVVVIVARTWRMFQCPLFKSLWIDR